MATKRTLGLARSAAGQYPIPIANVASVNAITRVMVSSLDTEEGTQSSQRKHKGHSSLSTEEGTQSSQRKHKGHTKRNTVFLVFVCDYFVIFVNRFRRSASFG